MKNILLADDEEDILNLLTEWLCDEIPDVNITCAKNGIEAIGYLNSDKIFDLIICDYYMPKSNGEEVYAYNFDHKKLPFIFLTGAFVEDLTSIKNLRVDNKKNFIILKPYDEESFLKKINGVLSGDVLKDKSFQEIQISQLRKYLKKSINFDVYCKISSEKYIKIVDSNAPFDIDIIDNYERKGEEYLYIEENEYGALMIEIENELRQEMSLVSSVDTLEPEGRVEILGNVFSFMHEALYSLGIGKRQIDLVDKSIDSCLMVLKQEKEIFPYIANLVETNNYFISQSVLTAHFSAIIASHLDFKSREIMSKLSYAALIQNMTLKDRRFSKVIDRESKAFLEFSRAEQEIILAHPHEAARIIESCAVIPSDIITLVENHHENPKGTGFPKGVGANYINALSAVFNLSVVISDHICKFGYKKESLEDLTSMLEKDYNVAMFKKPLAVFLELVRTEKN